ncbi:MAG: hypothetical protein K6T16_01780 [Candidatus Pacearchaeota archaeon]|nr:hypothetical protein [Candidatus Pacearchaeota archaeon]
MRKLKQRAFILLLISLIFVILLISYSLAGTQHGVNGFVHNSASGVSPNGLPVVFNVTNHTTGQSYCVLQDIVGKNGNAALDNWYATDLGNCQVQWQKDNIVYIFIGNSTHNASTSVVLSEFGNDQAPTVILGEPSFCGDGICNNQTETCLNCSQDCKPTCNNNTICEPCPAFCWPHPLNLTGCCENATNCIDCGPCNMNGTCDAFLGENCTNCPNDCHCPDGLCQPQYNETNLTCPYDCRCGNGICETITGPCGSYNETSANCVIDCPGCMCGNLLCEPLCGENHVNCPTDCNGTCDYDNVCEFGEFYAICPDCPLYCGNMICDTTLGENSTNCPSDCGDVICGDGICDVARGENWQNCPTDCYGLVARCGDGKCELAETEQNCCVDCACKFKKPCTVSKCIRNRCQPQCCLFGICCSIFICWYWYVLLILILIGLILYAAHRKKKKKAKHAAHHTSQAAHGKK